MSVRNVTYISLRLRLSCRHLHHQVQGFLLSFDEMPTNLFDLDSLLKPENKGTLVDILTYGIVSGKVLSTDLGPSQEVATVQGNTLLIKARDGAVTVNGRNVVAADNQATNGVMHIIDGVLLPPKPTPAPKNLVELAQSVDILSTFVATIVAADLVATLSSPGPFTVFAPTNDAFLALSMVDDLQISAMVHSANNGDKGPLADMLKYHIVSGKFLSTQLGPSQLCTTPLPSSCSPRSCPSMLTSWPPSRATLFWPSRISEIN